LGHSLSFGGESQADRFLQIGGESQADRFLLAHGLAPSGIADHLTENLHHQDNYMF
jgi:hypothetical protein